jgi:transposase
MRLSSSTSGMWKRSTVWIMRHRQTKEPDTDRPSLNHRATSRLYKMTMTKAKRGRYTLEFKQEAARLVESGQSQAAAARSLGVVEQTLANWVKAHRAGTLKGASSKPQVTAEQMENSRLRAELARVTMERDILGKATAFFAKCQR